MMIHKPTGRTRHRLHAPLFGKPVLVLQVEIHRTGYEVMDSHGNSFDRDDCSWRDATVDDLTIKEIAL